MDQNSEFGCPSCGETGFETFVQYGSYVIRCRSCKNSVATSWKAVGPKYRSHIHAYYENKVEGMPLLEGRACDLVEEIARLAESGTAIILIPVPDTQTQCDSKSPANK